MTITSDAVLAALRPERIEAHLRFLSSPLLEGRGVGSQGGRIAEEYIRAALAGMGLQPAPGTGYRQEVPMVGIEPNPELSFETGSGQSIRPRYRDEYVLEAGMPEPETVLAGELLFAGYGICAPEYDWDDYAGVDVRGKVLLVRVNDPGTPGTPDFFEGRALTYYGRWTYKFEEAARRGAAGVVLIHTDDSAGYGWTVVRNSNTGEQYSLAGPPEFPLRVRGWVTEAVGNRLLSAVGGDADAILAESDQRGFRARPVGATVHASVRSVIREVTTANVLGVLPGADRGRADEPVIIMAHHDHLGMTAGDQGVVIYPGAHDNASGVAVILAIADAFAASGFRPSRPLLFLASTAEESGLLGSDWYTRHPAFPLARTAAVLNVDGANLQGPTDDIAPLGVNRSTLGDLAEAASRAEGLDLTPEQHPEKGSFFRQDHFPFARAGVPGIAFDHGLRYRDRSAEWGHEWYKSFVASQYHQPTDAFSEEFDYRGAIQQARVMVRTAITAAESPELPDWRPGSQFKRR